ncbi:hypothetical protein ACWDWO_09235 [Actinopolymorpha singaporensis]
MSTPLDAMAESGLPGVQAATARETADSGFVRRRALARTNTGR